MSRRLGGTSNRTISVVIPCYNETRFLHAALESLSSQTHDDWEAIVVDDGSSETATATIESAVASDSRCRLVRHDQNRGLPAARNTGISNSTGAFVAFLDADDLLTARSLEERLETLEDHEDIEVAGSYTGVRFAKEEVGLESLPTLYASGPTEVIDFVSANGECPFPVHAPLLRRDVLRLAGGFDESIRHGTEDWDLWYRILRNGYVFVPTGTTSAVYRQRPGAMTRAFAVQHVANAKRLIDLADARTTVEAHHGGPSPLPKALWEYKAEIKQARRGLLFAAIAELEGADAPASILHSLGHVDWRVVARTLDIEGIARGASLRATGDPDAATHEALLFLRSVLSRLQTGPA